MFRLLLALTATAAVTVTAQQPAVPLEPVAAAFATIRLI